MLRILSAALCLGLAVNGIVMLAAPSFWYSAVPGVPTTGPFNAHFVRDIGAAYLTCTLCLGWFAMRPALGWSALVVTAVFLDLHALIHIHDAVMSPVCGRDLFRDLPGVFAPALLASAIAVLSRPSPQLRPPFRTRRAPMLKALLSHQITRFERTWDYDASYMRELLAASPWTFLRFSVVAAMTPRRDAPAAALAAVGIIATLAEDCGPCTQIIADRAVRDGVPPAVVKAILAGDRSGMGPDAALGYAFAGAVLVKAFDAADAARREVAFRWGQKGLVALSLALTAARIYPTVKYALGHGQTCSRVQVSGEPAAVVRPIPVAA